MDKAKSTKVLIAIIFFAVAAVALAYQFGVFGGGSSKVDVTDTTKPLQVRIDGAPSQPSPK